MEPCHLLGPQICHCSLELEVLSVYEQCTSANWFSYFQCRLNGKGSQWGWDNVLPLLDNTILQKHLYFFVDIKKNLQQSSQLIVIDESFLSTGPLSSSLVPNLEMLCNLEKTTEAERCKGLQICIFLCRRAWRSFYGEKQNVDIWERRFLDGWDPSLIHLYSFSQTKKKT